MPSTISQDIRKDFINYFKRHDHHHLESSSLLPSNDPSLMFVNAGMVPFKEIFTGNEQAKYKRVVSNQKCVRAGGKHNDLENVGYTARHHTFFEMLGNFSFGDYFKEEAIFYAWELLTKYFSLDPKKLYVTIYHTDIESRKLWQKISGLGEDKIIKISSNDNFWSMAELGPCGPCSEIFYDHGESLIGSLPGSSNDAGDRFTEIWNLVFMQYEQITKDKRILLPRTSVDTGMGLERISTIIEGVTNNYETYVFQDIINYTESILKVPAKGSALASYRIIADHLRSATFLIADGIMPSNEGRGYVLRRIMRRAIRHSYNLGAKELLLYQLFPKMKEHFSKIYPELIHSEEFIITILKQEEEKFLLTLERGLNLLNEATAQLSKNTSLAGAVAFKLYDTYGFPVDLTADILKQQGLKLDYAGFEQAMRQQKDQARKSWSGSGQNKTANIWFNFLQKYGATEFLGYKFEEAEGKILSLIIDNREQKEISIPESKFILIANQTPFYGEAGGQIGDRGLIKTSQSQIRVVDTKKYLGKIIAHICLLEKGVIKSGDIVKLTIDRKQRQYLKIYHTATHILHAALREIIGLHVKQKGSLVAAQRLRFDFSHMQPLSEKELTSIENKVNEVIMNNSPLLTEVKDVKTAIKDGALALFDEKYDDNVRVVSFGNNSLKTSPYSLELCGGTHVNNTGDIGLFKIISEYGIASGVRRIEAICGEQALANVNENENRLKQAVNLLKTNKNELIDKIEKLVSTNKHLERKIEQVEINQLILTKEIIITTAKKLRNIRYLQKEFNNIDIKIARIAAQQLVKNYPDLIIIYQINQLSNVTIIIAVPKSLTTDYSANKIAKIISPLIKGQGGGSATLAQLSSKEINFVADTKLELDKILQQVFKECKQ